MGPCRGVQGSLGASLGSTIPEGPLGQLVACWRVGGLLDSWWLTRQLVARGNLGFGKN